MSRDGSRSNRDLAYWLALMRIPSASNRLLHQLLEKAGTAEAVFALDKQTLSALGVKAGALAYIQAPERDRIKADLAWLAQAGHHLISIDAPHYPALLKEIPDPPVALFVNGNPEVINTLQLAIVGSRKPTGEGCRQAGEFAAQLVACGVTVSSGLASGIDTCAHRGSLSAGGKTVAVLGHGLDMIYPAANRQLAETIAASGALVSAYPLGYKPLPHHFPARNRIISGLSLGVLVVEAAAKSGSLITARHASEQGREVFAIPGSIRNPLREGCHALIRDGAKLVGDIGHIVEELGPLAGFVAASSPPADADTEALAGLDAETKLLLDNIGYEAISIDALVEASGLPVNILSAALLRLEMLNLIESLAGSNYIRK